MIWTHNITTLPCAKQWEGWISSQNKIVKNIFKTAEDPWEALLEWRASPNRDFRNPAERLYSRKIWTMVPQPTEAMRVQTPDLDEIASARRERQQRMTDRYDKGTRDMPQLKHGQPVLLRQVNDRATKWRPAQILEPVTNRSYLILKMIKET